MDVVESGSRAGEVEVVEHESGDESRDDQKSQSEHS
jgi:hypothetical protein